MTPAELIAARKRLDLSQAAMARKLGMSRQGYLNLESGLTPINLRTAYAVWFLETHPEGVVMGPKHYFD